MSNCNCGSCSNICGELVEVTVKTVFGNYKTLVGANEYPDIYKQLTKDLDKKRFINFIDYFDDMSICDEDIPDLISVDAIIGVNSVYTSLKEIEEIANSEDDDESDEELESVDPVEAFYSLFSEMKEALYKIEKNMHKKSTTAKKSAKTGTTKNK